MPKTTMAKHDKDKAKLSQLTTCDITMTSQGSKTLIVDTFEQAAF